MHIFQNGSLVIHDVAPEDSGRYTCIAGNSCNIKHTEAPLYVVGMSRGQEVGGPDFFLIFVLIGPLYTGGTQTIFVAGAQFSSVPSVVPWHSLFPCLERGCHVPQLGCV